MHSTGPAVNKAKVATAAMQDGIGICHGHRCCGEFYRHAPWCPSKFGREPERVIFSDELIMHALGVSFVDEPMKDIGLQYQTPEEFIARDDEAFMRSLKIEWKPDIQTQEA